MHVQIVPFIYGSKPALLQLGSDKPYSVIYAAVRRDAALAAGLVAALAAWAVVKLVLGLLG